MAPTYDDLKHSRGNGKFRELIKDMSPGDFITIAIEKGETDKDTANNEQRERNGVRSAARSMDLEKDIVTRKYNGIVYAVYLEAEDKDANEKATPKTFADKKK
jgi:hypothetical protein